MSNNTESKPRKFRKKPVEIEAIRFHEDDHKTPDDVARWCGGYVRNNLGHPSGRVAIVIPTLEGEMTAQHGDWIIRGVQGEFYPCKPDIFELTYDEVPRCPDCGTDLTHSDWCEACRWSL